VACAAENGQSGRRQSHQQALQMAQQQGWRNYLLLEDDVVILKQEKHISVLNALLGALTKLPWEVVILGGKIRQGTVLKSLNGMIHARDCRKVCAYLVNGSYYATLAQQLQHDPSATPEAQWQPLLREGKWLACYPSLCYQRPGYSDIEKKETDNIGFYFNKINKSPASVQPARPAQPPSAAATDNLIAFFMETAFHYAIYRPIITALQAKGHVCTLLINDRTYKPFLDEMLATIKTINDPALGGVRISEIMAQGKRFKCLVSPYYVPDLNNLAEIQVRAMYGLAKEEWNHAWWNAFYHRILCYGPYSQQALDINGSAKVVGNPRFDLWHQGKVDTSLPESLKLDARKPLLLYAPTYGALSSLPHWAEKLESLSRDYNIITKLHHGTCSRPEEKTALALANKHLRKRLDGPEYVLPLLACADYVLTDNSGFIFDAIHVGKKVILLDWPGLDSLLRSQQSYSSPYSAEQRLREVLPVVRNTGELRDALSINADWAARHSRLDDIRQHYCDPFMDGRAGERAAQEIISAIANSELVRENRFLTSLQKKLF
jgi:Putative glycosyl/glycerophosphate transferases involved in teichoic acid biosynthesis TagF/TagB/EpsJ/RodC